MLNRLISVEICNHIVLHPDSEQETLADIGRNAAWLNFRIFAIELRMTLTCKMDQSQRYIIWQSNASVRLLNRWDSNVCPFCHRLRDNHVWIFQMLAIPIFDLQKGCRDHEATSRQLRHWITICMFYNFVKKWRSISNCFRVVHQRSKL